MGKEKLHVLYHEPSDSLGIAGETWDYVVLIKFVPFVSRVYVQKKLQVDYSDPVEYVEHPIAQPRDSNWVFVGEL